MLGRKAIHHNANKNKRKWQLELDKGDGGDSSDSEGEPTKAAGKKEESDAGDSDAPVEEPKKRRADSDHKAPERRKADEGDDDSESGGGDGKRFAWMDSDDESSEERKKAKDSGGSKKAPVQPKTPAVSSTAPVRTAAPSRPGGPPLAVPPGAKLPRLTQEHLHLMQLIAASRSLDDLWDIIDQRYESFAPAHAATVLFRLTLLANVVEQVFDSKIEKNTSFGRLTDRLDELLATSEGRENFMTADLAMTAAGLAKLVYTRPATSGAIGRIFAELADEADARIADEPAVHPLMLLSDLSWGIARTGNSTACFLRSIVSSAKPRLQEATCQDLSNFSAAFAESAADEADELLSAVYRQTKQRLEYSPPVGVNVLAFNAGGPLSAASIQAAAGAYSASASSAASEGRRREDTPAWQLAGQWRFTGTQISEILMSVTRHIGLYDQKLFSLVADVFKDKLQEFTVPELVKLRDSFDLVRHEKDVDFLQALRTSLKAREFAVRRGPPGPPIVGRR
eukprot:TRINITY_DN103344_c0_g1_i1.p1 TRINITY_DN103344_c0_g1~~TRINITY_DN103344_c0_g1_i1.p1  ORF type:complete len:510 (-),score=131.81 TRINITY_DN103344_c0_g1_i1:81-1610(-)